MKRFLSTTLLAGTLALGAASAQVFVRVGPPPPPPREFVPVRPGPQHVWINGFYRWNGARYVYVPGQWAFPPRPHYHQWIPGHWREIRRGWVWVEGHWR